MLTPYILAVLLPWIHANYFTAIYPQHDKRLIGHVMRTITQTDNQFACLVNCDAIPGCHSYNYNSDKRVCELNAANHLSHPSHVIRSDGFMYFNYFLHPVKKCDSRVYCGINSSSYECIVQHDGISFKCDRREKILAFPRKNTTDYVAVDKSSSSDNSFTVALWVQTQSTTPACFFQYSVKHINNPNMLRHAISLGIDGSCIRLDVMGSLSRYCSSIKFNDGSWHHIALTWLKNNGIFSLFVGGVLQNQTTTYFNGIGGNGLFLLGQEAYLVGIHKESRSFQGNLSAVNMWDKHLTEPEIKDLAQSCTKGEGNFVKWSDLIGYRYGNVRATTTYGCV